VATRTLNRRALRDQNDAAEPDKSQEDSDEAEERVDEDAPKPRARKKAPAKPKDPAKPRIRKKTVKVPDRMVARWAVCDNGAKRVAVFEYRDRAGADAKLVEVRERKPGTYYLALVKDPYDPPATPAVVA
jgi:polyphosphate kinase 2 (PPK2 family)